MAKAGTLNISSATNRCTLKINITGMKRLKARIWLGVRLLRFACFIIGCKVEISDEWEGRL